MLKDLQPPVVGNNDSCKKGSGQCPFKVVIVIDCRTSPAYPQMQYLLRNQRASATSPRAIPAQLKQRANATIRLRSVGKQEERIIIEAMWAPARYT